MYFGKINFEKTTLLNSVFKEDIKSNIIGFINILISFLIFVNIFLFIIKKFNTTYLNKISNINIKNTFKFILIGLIFFITIPIICLILFLIKIGYVISLILFLLYILIILISIVISFISISNLILSKILNNYIQENNINGNSNIHKYKYFNIYSISSILILLFTVLLYIPYLNILVIFISIYFGIGNLFNSILFSKNKK